MTIKHGSGRSKTRVRAIALTLVAVLMGTGTAASAQLAPVTTANLGKGWNLGNSLDAASFSGKFPKTTSQETYWGNPAINQQIFDGIAAAGFKSVRIPVSWFQYMDRNNNIQPFMLARVKQVVDMARNAGLYVILNQHHDNGQLDVTSRNAARGNAWLTTLWTQVGNYFKGYDNHLLFAGINEVGADSGPATAEACAIHAGFNQAFVNAVRATGGNNATRTLVFQGYWTNIDNMVNECGAKAPTDSATGRLMAEAHFYDPWLFTLDGNSPLWQWGSIATDPAATAGWGNEDFVDGQMQKLKVAFADKGIPVIIGEYGAISKTEYDAPMKYRNYWDNYVTASIVRHGFAPFYWDNGYPDNHQFGLFNRNTGAQYYPTTVSAIVNAQ